MSGKLPRYKYCPVCKKQIPIQAIICLYCEEPLLPQEEEPGGMYGEAILLTTVEPAADDIMDILEMDGEEEIVEIIPDPEDDAGEEWKRKGQHHGKT